jgi:hypothetical protein
MKRRALTKSWSTNSWNEFKAADHEPNPLPSSLCKSHVVARVEEPSSACDVEQDSDAITAFGHWSPTARYPSSFAAHRVDAPTMTARFRGAVRLPLGAVRKEPEPARVRLRDQPGLPQSLRATTRGSTRRLSTSPAHCRPGAARGGGSGRAAPGIHLTARTY